LISVTRNRIETKAVDFGLAI
jgi:Ran GTPase-activating protein (RanGAP) involved in mRNA processing and transport